MSRYQEIDISKVKTYSIADRQSKVDVDQQAKPQPPDGTFHQFWESLPQVLASRDLKELVGEIVRSAQKKKPVILMMGAHVIKVGLNPVIIDLMKNGLIQALVLNGAGSIHDTELAYFGKTSEDVAAFLKDGRFGMVQETADILNGAVCRGNEMQMGFGESLGFKMTQDQPPHREFSLFYNAYQLEIPVTVHVGMGTDIVHQHPTADGGAIGEASLRDFRILADLVSGIHDGGVVLLFGSSVVLPEVFLKALTVARNVAGPVTGFTTANFDMIRHYRPQVNVLQRPTRDGGRGFFFTGHHELMLPLLAAGIKNALAQKRDSF